MKRFIFISLVMSLVSLVYSQQVSRQEAVNAAVNTMKYNGRTNLAISSISSVSSKNNGDMVLIYEVIFQSGEMVLLSGNKACIPVLGYSLPSAASAPQSILGNYADIPDGLRDLLSEYEEQILYCFRNNLTSSHYEEWQDLQHFESGRTVTIDIVSPLLTTKWGQSFSNDWGYDCNAYNYYVTETLNSCSCEQKTCPTGCVATAMAQIMKYWNFPVWLPNRAEQFDWCNMPDELIYLNNDNYVKERNAIARLMKDCGTVVNMDYCQSNRCESGAYSTSVPSAFLSFLYSNDIEYKERTNTNNWISRLKTDLDARRPIYYRGKDDNGQGGHAFVCDGYRSDNTFHFNWGWNGICNMWCTVDQLNPSNYHFNSQQAAVFNIHPAGTQDYCDFEAQLWSYYNYYYNVYGNSTPDPHEIVPKTFTRLTSVPNEAPFPSTWRTIPSGENSEYVAHEEILLQDGFLAEMGSDFYAHIVPCPSCEEREIVNVDTLDESNADTLVVTKLLQTETSFADNTSLRVYPNPTDDILYVELSGAGIQFVGLYDLQGRVVGANNYSPLQGIAAINVRSVPAGVYVLRVTDENGREYHRKVVVK
jgi:hypothetical protein